MLNNFDEKKINAAIFVSFQKECGRYCHFKLVSKTLSNIKNCLEINLCRKKEHFAKHLAVSEFFRTKMFS